MARKKPETIEIEQYYKALRSEFLLSAKRSPPLGKQLSTSFMSISHPAVNAACICDHRSMDVRRYGDPSTFLAAATPLLAEDEPRHNLLFGIADTLIRRPHAYLTFHLWIVADDAGVAGVALQTPPHNVVVARPRSDAALSALAEAIVADGDAVPGVSAALPEAEIFADLVADRSGRRWARRMSMGVYACRSVRPVEPADGTSRLAESGDFDRLFPMVVAFADEALTEPGRTLACDDAAMHARLRDDPLRGGFWIRETRGGIVSLSGHGGRTPNGIRIGPVYTPPEERRRGYATALVHDQTAWLLANAVDACFLYTDMANPTSNWIYRTIGYEQICDAVEIGFDGPPEAAGDA